MKRLNVLLSAFACRPGKGSEPGVGWNMALEMANHHNIWVLAQGKNRSVIEAELSRNPVPGLHFVYYDLPRWASWWRRDQRGIQLYYYMWQFGAYRIAKRLCYEVGIELAQHVTFATYWKPSLVALLPVPFIWGPVGGGESTPKALLNGLGLRGRMYEASRGLARWLGEHDPFVRATARRSVRALATTDETAVRLRYLGAKKVQVLTACGLSGDDLELLHQSCLRSQMEGEDRLRFVSVGRLLHLKGFHLGLRAFAQARLPAAEYWIVGDGPERRRLKNLAEELRIADRVKFLGQLSREETLHRLADCHVLVHPSLHDSGGWVCLEAMASECPVVCLDLGGPSVLVTEATGFKVPATRPEETVNGLTAAMQKLANDHSLRVRMGGAARRRVIERFHWHEKGIEVSKLYR